MRDLHPLLVLSSPSFNERTSLVIGRPMSTAEDNTDNPFAAPIGQAKGRKVEKTSDVLCHQPKSFDWRVRRAAPHPTKRISDEIFGEACARLNQIVKLAID